MRYHVQVDLKVPLDTAVALYSDTGARSKWMKYLEAYEVISGEPMQAGSKARLVLQDGRRRTELVETIVLNRLPEEINGEFEGKGVFHRITVRFEAIDRQLTRYHTYNHYEFRGYTGWLAMLMPNAFRRHTLEQMLAFKEWVEGEILGSNQIF